MADYSMSKTIQAVIADMARKEEEYLRSIFGSDENIERYKHQFAIQEEPLRVVRTDTEDPSFPIVSLRVEKVLHIVPIRSESDG